MANILLTGGAGYIGSHIAHDLIDRGFDVTILDNLTNGSTKFIPKKAKFIKTDIGNLSFVSKILNKNKFDALIHLAAYISVDESVKHPKKYMANNYEKSKKLINLCIKNNVKKIVFASTGAVYGKKMKKKIKENSKVKPVNPYGMSKLLFERYLDKIKNKNFNYCILRYFNVAGADLKLRCGQLGKKHKHLIKQISEVLSGKKKIMVIHGNDYPTPDGTGVRDYIHVSDISDIHVKAVKYLLKNKSKKSLIMNCGYGNGFSVLEIIKQAQKIKKFKYIFRDRRKGDVPYLVADINRLKYNLKWKPKYNNINKIIQSAFKWEVKTFNK